MGAQPYGLVKVHDLPEATLPGHQTRDFFTLTEEEEVEVSFVVEKAKPMEVEVIHVGLPGADIMMAWTVAPATAEVITIPDKHSSFSMEQKQVKELCIIHESNCDGSKDDNDDVLVHYSVAKVVVTGP